MKFNVAEISCNHCTGAITKALLTLDEDAKLIFDLASRTVSVESDLSAEEVTAAIKEAGYEASEVKVSCCNSSNSCHEEIPFNT
ncbi:heavy-metal-associated domain-containing protein [Pseudoalteromonas sp. S16_S37]|nr:heavy-metal-associated domain-containing protein [Pseudoalteromonas sp. S16_S37]